jgi:hypothetical protein
MVVEDTEEDAIEMAVCTGRDQIFLKGLWVLASNSDNQIETP